MKTNPDDLQSILAEMLKDLGNPANHYMSATYFEYVGSDNPDLGKHFIAIVYLHHDAAWNVMLSEEGLYGDVLLNQHNPEEKSRIRIPLLEIWGIQKSDSSTFTNQHQVFYSEAVFKEMLSARK